MQAPQLNTENIINAQKWIYPKNSKGINKKNECMGKMEEIHLY